VILVPRDIWQYLQVFIAILGVWHGPLVRRAPIICRKATQWGMAWPSGNSTDETLKSWDHGVRVASQGGWKTGENQFPGHTKLGSDSATPIASEGLRCSQQSEARYVAWKPSTATVPDLQYPCLLTALNIKCTFIQVLNSPGQVLHENGPLPPPCLGCQRSRSKSYTSFPFYRWETDVHGLAHGNQLVQDRDNIDFKPWVFSPLQAHSLQDSSETLTLPYLYK
jgi:hypothetical protein